jgi:hypothetical protein
MVRALLIACGAALLTGAPFVAATNGSPQPAQDRPLLPLERAPYTVQTFDGRKLEGELGRLSVLETRGGSHERRIQLACVRLAARAAKPGPPIVFLMEGPGMPAVS